MALFSFRRVLQKQQELMEYDKIQDETLKKLGLTRAELKDMSAQFRGSIYVPGDPGYKNAREKGNPLYPAYPLIICYPEDYASVALCLQWSRNNSQWWVAIRSGAHSTAGYSNNSGMVIDMSRLAYVSINPLAMVMTVQSGADFGAVNSMLNSYKVHTPGGGCPDVCIGGFMQGGGYGFTSREFGMNCDNVIEFQMMLYDGSIVVANPSQNRNLFWAVRGGTGNNFGVLLSVTYKLYSLYNVWGWALQWSLDDAPQALSALQQGYMRTGAPKELGYQAMLATTTVNNSMAFVAIGMYHGATADGLTAIQPLRSVGNPTLVYNNVGTYNDLNEAMLYQLLSPPPANNDLIEFKQSGYISSPVSPTDWEPIVSYYAEAPNKYAMMGIEPYGGAIASYAGSPNSFIHRDVDCDLFVDSFFNAGGAPTTKQQAKDFLDGMMALLQPQMNGEVYQNYPYRGLVNFSNAYWLDAYPGLQVVKTAYDPTNFFRFEQSIVPKSVEDVKGMEKLPGGYDLVKEDIVTV